MLEDLPCVAGHLDRNGARQASHTPSSDGIAVQVHQDEPRTTLDIDVAVRDRSAIPAAALRAAGVVHIGSYAHPENWVGAGSTPVRFTDDPHLRDVPAAHTSPGPPLLIRTRR
jgi:hypothetical protein